MPNKFEGGCLCEGIRYAITGDPIDGFHCHCSMCRRSSGSGHQSWSMVLKSDFNLKTGILKFYVSSTDARREFCPDCGTQISSQFTSDPDHVFVSMGSLDTPEAVKPSAHIFVTTSLSWDEQDDGLPRFDGMPPVCF